MMAAQTHGRGQSEVHSRMLQLLALALTVLAESLADQRDTLRIDRSDRPMRVSPWADRLNVPDWSWEPKPTQVAQHCLSVPNVTGVWYNESITWTNNSRLLSVAVPEGTPPPDGWPVMVDLLVIDYPSLFGQPICGLDGGANSETHEYPASKACKALGQRVCGYTLNTTYYECSKCFQHNRTELMTACAKTELYALERQNCPARPQPAPLNTSCSKALAAACNWTFAIPDKTIGHRLQRHNCSMCVARATLNLTNDPANGCPQVHGAPHSATWNESSAMARVDMEKEFCTLPDQKRPGKGHTRQFFPFASPQRLAMSCSCINASDDKFRCAPPYDDDNHGHPFVPPGGFCSFDVFAGGLWSQHLKQYLLNNGIAVVEANNYVQDGWESWDDEWEGGYDAQFFKQLAAAMSRPADGNRGDPADLSNLDPNRVAFRGWSGSAQMVSWLINQDARGQLPGLKVAAGIMMAGGSHACYNWPGHGAINNCAQCNMSEAYRWDPNAFGCSSTAAARGVVGGQPYCELCCPTNYTEDYYAAHPDQYTKHPPTFLIQTELDSGADSCAAKHYHATMLAHGAHSEIGIIPLDQQRCFSIGNPGDSAVPKADKFERFCKDPNATSLNHTQGFAGAVVPLTRFLVKALDVTTPALSVDNR